MDTKKMYRVNTVYIFNGVFEVMAENEEDAREKVLEECGMTMHEGISSTIPDEEIDWDFCVHPLCEIDQVTELD